MRLASTSTLANRVVPMRGGVQPTSTIGTLRTGLLFAIALSASGGGRFNS